MTLKAHEYALQASKCTSACFKGSLVSMPHYGLPYTAAPPKNSGTYPWSDNYETARNTISWNGDGVKMEGVLKKQTITSPEFHIPADINVEMIVPAKLYSYAVWPGKAIPMLVCRIGDTEVAKQAGATPGAYGDKTLDYTANGTATLKTSNKHIEVENTYTMSSAYIYIYSISLNYI